MNLPMNIFLGVAAIFWVASLVFCGLAWRWSVGDKCRRFIPALVLGVLSLLIGYFGMRNVNMEYSKRVNGKLVQHWKSQWFFEVTLVLAVVTLGFVIYREVMSRRKLAAGLHGTAIPPGTVA